MFGEPQGEIFQNFLLKLKVKMYCKVYELIKFKKKKQQISLSLFRSYFISNDVDQ
jgi:hypothetical protein